MVVCTLQGRMENNLMKKIIDGIVYDTEVSKKLGSFMIMIAKKLLLYL